MAGCSLDIDVVSVHFDGAMPHNDLDIGYVVRIVSVNRTTYPRTILCSSLNNITYNTYCLLKIVGELKRAHITRKLFLKNRVLFAMRNKMRPSKWGLPQFDQTDLLRRA